MRQRERAPGPLARSFLWLGELIDDIESVLAPYFLLIVCLITIAGFAGLWWKLG